MTIDPTSAAAAYRANAAGERTFGAGRASGPAERAGLRFVDLVKDAAQEAVEADAEETLKTVVTVRDRVISAYQEILRMPI